MSGRFFTYVEEDRHTSVYLDYPDGDRELIGVMRWDGPSETVQFHASGPIDFCDMQELLEWMMAEEMRLRDDIND